MPISKQGLPEILRIYSKREVINKYLLPVIFFVIMSYLTADAQRNPERERQKEHIQNEEPERERPKQDITPGEERREQIIVPKEPERQRPNGHPDRTPRLIDPPAAIDNPPQQTYTPPAETPSQEYYPPADEAPIFVPVPFALLPY